MGLSVRIKRIVVWQPSHRNQIVGSRNRLAGVSWCWFLQLFQHDRLAIHLGRRSKESFPCFGALAIVGQLPGKRCELSEVLRIESHAQSVLAAMRTATGTGNQVSALGGKRT